MGEGSSSNTARNITPDRSFDQLSVPREEEEEEEEEEAQPAAGGGRLCGAGRVRSGDDDDERTKICSNAGWDGALT
ncbi:hypothetical protein FQA47_021112 [Oryzias melastigma]|uniref:Uncharacterized protein n=1 Tax=Oryzias melastigma TaxID=30732 RepID=A0A834C3Z6_ORYME|nr:hypothetical protein FQA47_021112 [Oryzias melastigma]